MRTRLLALCALGLFLSCQVHAWGQSGGAGSDLLRFSGYDWLVKTSDSKVGPGPNYFSKDAVELTPRGLTLKAIERNGQVFCGEVVSKVSFGYGTYRFAVNSNVDDLAPNLVLGLFTWSDEAAYAHRELDVEISRWADPGNDNAQFVVQPYTRAGNVERFSIPRGYSSTTYSFTWSPEKAMFRAEANTAAGPVLIREHTFVGGIPKAGGENARINLWMVSGKRASPGAVQVSIGKFEFLPLGGK